MRKVAGILLIIVGILLILISLAAVLTTLSSHNNHQPHLLAYNLGFAIGCLILPVAAIVLAVVLIRFGRRLIAPKTRAKI